MKYRLTSETLDWFGHTLYRIECVEAFGNVETGQKGGWVESELNLSQKRYCWIYDEGKVFGGAKVIDDACVYNRGQVSGQAVVKDGAYIKDDALVSENATISDYATIKDFARVMGYAKIRANARIRGHAFIRGKSEVYEYACVRDNCEVTDYAKVCGFVDLSGFASITLDAEIRDQEDYIVFKNNFSSGRYFTWTRSNDKWSVGCFRGDGERLIKKAYEDGWYKGECYKAYVEFVKNLNKIQSDFASVRKLRNAMKNENS